jgi:probable DNA metabolism protein
MRVVCLEREDDFEGWRDAARDLAVARVPAADVVWQVGEGQSDLFGDEAVLPALDGGGFSVPRTFVALARTVVCHRDPDRFALLYALLLRVRPNPKLMDDRADALLLQLEQMAKAVRRDMHKMRAFVRFREVGGGDPRFVAWFEPDHSIMRINAGFFVRRFATMHWSILSPALSIHWDGETLIEGPGAVRADAPQGDSLEETWATYYASIFNPARVKVGAMMKEMPKKYWRNMPEAALIPELVAGAQAREQSMVAASRTIDHSNSGAAWEKLREEAVGCTRCPLFKCATQTVFGEGPVDATLMLLGEQPGDQEDLAGKPFVGPAGQLLDRALDAAGIDRGHVYVSNAVKHFKFEQRGKRRIHAKPNAGEIQACRWWYEQERALIRPRMTLALGATAARSMLGKAVTIAGARGVPHALPDGGEGRVTVHPSYLLRIDDKADAAAEYARFVEDLREAAGNP